MHSLCFYVSKSVRKLTDLSRISVKICQESSQEQDFKRRERDFLLFFTVLV